MKKLISVILVLILCLTTSCSADETYEMLCMQYPDAEIRSDGNIYSVISENVQVNFENLDTNYGYGENGPHFTNLSVFENNMIADRRIVFKGKKTGNSKQYIPVDKETGNVSGLFFTESKVEVIEAFYGNIEAGEEIVYRESYATFRDETGTTKTIGYKTPTNSEEYIYVLCMNPGGELYDGAVYSDAAVNIDPIPISYYEKRFDGGVFVGSTQRRVSDDVFEKYIIKKDIALDAESEYKKLLDWRVEYSKRDHGDLENKENKEKDMINYYRNNPLELTDEDKELVDDLLKKYGQK